MPPAGFPLLTPLRSLPWSDPRLALAITLAAELLFVILLYGPLFVPLNQFGIIDYDQFLAWQLAVNDALGSGQLLHWAHHFCGGVPGLADPQSGALSPFNLPGLLFNPVVQMKISVAVHLCASAAGFHLLAQRARWPVYFAMAAFVIWSGNGFIVFRLLHGQETFYPLLYLPLMLALLWPYLAADGEPGDLRRDLLAGTALVALMILEDGFQILIYGGIFLGVAGLTALLLRRDGRALGMLAAWMGWAICLCAVRLLPMAELLREYPRITTEQDFLTLQMMLDAFFNPHQLQLYAGFQPSPPHNVWAAYGAFTGWAPLALSGWGVMAAWSRRSDGCVPLLAAALVCFLLMLGHFAAWSPWALLHSLPLMDMVRAPHRFAGMVIFGIAIFAFFAQQDILRRLHGREGSALLIALIVAGVCAYGQIRALRPLLEAGFAAHQPPHRSIDRDRPFVHRLVDSTQMYSSVAANIGVWNCYRALELPNAARPDFPLASPSHGDSSVGAVIGPNTINLQIENASVETILINENYHRHWAVVAGRADRLERTPDGLMALHVPPGSGGIRLRFVPRTFIAGAVLSLAVLLLSLLALWRWPAAGAERCASG